MLAGLPQPHTLGIDSAPTSVIAVGDGPPVPLLHGSIECGGATSAPCSQNSRSTTVSSCPTFPGGASRRPSAALTSRASAAGLRVSPNTRSPTLETEPLTDTELARIDVLPRCSRAATTAWFPWQSGSLPPTGTAGPFT